MAAVPYAHVTQGPALVRPLATPVVVPRRNGINPLIPLCCLGLILFLIAATIVLALIPVYLKSRGNRINTQAYQYNALYRLNNGTLPLGTLRDDNCAAIQQDQRNLIASNRNALPSTVSVSSCTTIGNTTVTSRRRRQVPGQAEGNLLSIIGLLIGGDRCFRGSCLLQRAENFRALLLGRGTFFLTLAGANGTRFVFSVTVISFSIVPVPVSPGNTGGQTAVQTAAQSNDIAILNFALILERLESTFYTRYQNNFTRNDFVAAGFPNETFDYFNLIASHENTHVTILQSLITQLGGTPVQQCTFNFTSVVVDVPSYVRVAALLESTGAMAYTGAANGIADTVLRQLAATIATVEARHAAYLNILNGTVPFPDVFQPAATPADIVTAISPFTSCPFQITLPVVPYIGSSSYSGTPPTTNNTAISAYTQAMYTNDLRVLNIALIAEQLESTFYERYASNFTFNDFANSELSAAMIAAYFQLIRSYEAAHANFLRQTITGRGGTPVPFCTYTFNVTNASDFVQISRALENTGQKTYDGAINAISDPVLIQGAATIGLVEARFASFLNFITGNVPFPNATDPTLTPAQFLAVASQFQTCPFTPQLPVVLNPSTFSPNL